MSGNNENNTWNLSNLTQEFEQLESYLGSNSYCIKNCIDTTAADLSEQERRCYANCESIYKVFRSSYEKNFHLNNKY
jgi:hypothetical protein